MFDPLKLDEQVNSEPKKNEENTDIISEIVESLDWQLKNEDKEILLKEIADSKTNTNTIYDINIVSLEEAINYTALKTYDFFIVSPEDDKVKISFRKDKIEIEAKYVKFPVYNELLMKAKTISKMDITKTDLAQEWSWEMKIAEVNYKLTMKTSPSNTWEKIYIKVDKLDILNSTEKKVVKKASFASIASFFSTILFAALIIGWSLITFVVYNVKTIDDVKFFSSLWISLNEINSFIATSVWIIFSVLLLIETILLAIFLYKFFLTKKEEKKKKITRWIVSVLLLIITLSTLSGWMIIDKKIKSLPNWQEESYWDVKILDNSKLTSDFFDSTTSIIEDTTNLIWPITIKYDLDTFKKRELRSWFTVKKFIWDFGDGEKIETLEASNIKTFDKVWTYDVKIVAIEDDIHGKQIEKIIEDATPIQITNIVKIEEEKLDDSWKTVKFDANDLKKLWKIEWYFIEKGKTNDLKTTHIWYTFTPWQVIYEEILIWMRVVNSETKDSDPLDRIFVVNPNENSEIAWTLETEQNPLNDLEYNMWIANQELNFWNWFIKEFKWNVDDNKMISNKANPNDLEASSKIKYTFLSYGEHHVKVELIDGAWNTKTLKKDIYIEKKIKIKNNLNIYNENKIIDNYRYEDENYEYFIEVWSPTSIKIDATNIEADNLLYILDKVEWDTNNDWKTDEIWKNLEYKINNVWNHTIWVKYIFKNRKKDWLDLIIKWAVYIKSEKKEAILDLKMIYNSNYAPVIVAFDASKSEITGKDIKKFIFDYGDGSPLDERDAINQWHKYLKDWEYDIVLTVISSDWKKYSITKKLILKPQSQSVDIKASMKKTEVFNEIDFSSQNSVWQIESYLWDFGDGETSMEANPSHAYNKKWTYTVKLTVEFSNKNTLSKQTDIIIVSN